MFPGTWYWLWTWWKDFTLNWWECKQHWTDARVTQLVITPQTLISSLSTASLGDDSWVNKAYFLILLLSILGVLRTKTNRKLAKFDISSPVTFTPFTICQMNSTPVILELHFLLIPVLHRTQHKDKYTWMIGQLVGCGWEMAANAFTWIKPDNWKFATKLF